MGRLIDRTRQQQAKQARAARKLRILAVAERSFVELPPNGVDLDVIGRRANVEAGIVSLYFGSPEELFFAVLRGQVEAWRSDLEERLARVGGSHGVDRVAADVAASLACRPEMLRLVGIAPQMLEGCADITTALGFARWYHAQLEAVAAVAARRCRGCDQATVVRAVHRAQVVAGALSFAANPRGAGILIHDDVGGLDVQLATEIERLVRSYLVVDG